MSLDKHPIPFSAKQISIMDKQGKFDYEHLVQRGLVWERSRKSGLIESMILGYPIPPIYCRRDTDPNQPKKKSTATYVIMDGKQRLNTIASFIRNEWSLTPLPKVSYTTYDEEEASADISGMTFEELPDEIQDTIKDTMLNIIYFESITPAEEIELFKRLNAGKPLSTKARILANCIDLRNILDIGSHVMFRSMMTENALSQKNHVTVIMKMWEMLNQNIDEISFESKHFNSVVESTVINEDQKIILREVMDFMEVVHNMMVESEDKQVRKLAKKFYTETHLVSLVPFVKRAYEQGIDEEMFVQWIVDFFNTEADKDVSDYLTACASGSAKNENIKIRHQVLDASFNEFFKEG